MRRLAKAALLMLVAATAITTVIALSAPPAEAGCTRTSGSYNSRQGGDFSVGSTVSTTCDPSDLTGLSVEELWAMHCYLFPYDEGDRVRYRFETLAQSDLELVAEIQANAGERSNFAPDDDVNLLDVDASANLYIPRATIDLSGIYAHLYVTCDNVDSGNDLTYVMVRALTDFVDPIALRNAAEARRGSRSPTRRSAPTHRSATPTGSASSTFRPGSGSRTRGRSSVPKRKSTVRQRLRWPRCRPPSSGHPATASG